MGNTTTPLTDTLYEYMLAHGVRPMHVLEALREETLKLPNGYWVSFPEQVTFLQMLIRLLGARRVLEVGTFTGYATLAMALALPEGGKIVTCDIASGWSEMGVHYWRQARVENRIDRRIGRADTVMRDLLDADGRGNFDLIFLDANKSNYARYLDLVEGLLRAGGLLVADDVFWKGRVADPHDTDELAHGVRAFNTALFADDRFDIAMVPMADGMTLARKK